MRVEVGFLELPFSAFAPISVFQCADLMAAILFSMLTARVVASWPRDIAQVADLCVTAKVKERVQQDNGCLSVSRSFVGTSKMARFAVSMCDSKAPHWLLSRFGSAIK